MRRTALVLAEKKVIRILGVADLELLIGSPELRILQESLGKVEIYPIRGKL